MWVSHYTFLQISNSNLQNSIVGFLDKLSCSAFYVGIRGFQFDYTGTQSFSNFAKKKYGPHIIHIFYLAIQIPKIRLCFLCK